MLSYIENSKSWNNIKIKKIDTYYFGNIDIDLLKIFVSKINKNLDKLSVSFLKKNLKNFKGNYAVILKINNSLSLAFVDRIKSTPIFVAKIGKKYQFSNHAPSLKKKITNINNIDSVLSVRMSGYCIGRNTLYENLWQLLPGEACLIKNESLKYFNYYSFIKKIKLLQDSKSRLSKKLSNITLSIIEELINRNKGRKIIVPLSGGYDSRLIVSALHHLKAKNVECYSYGKKNNFEVVTAKTLAKKLNYPWYFVELNNRNQHFNFKSETYKKYTEFSDTLASWSYVQDLFAVQKLISRKVIHKESVIINGNTGDFISGGHLPRYNESLTNKNSKLDFILNYILLKHFSLWENYFSTGQYDKIKNLILKSIPKNIMNLPEKEIYKIYEYVEFINRQSNYVIQGQRVYDFFNINWELPLWHDHYLEFWNKVPYKFKLNQALYKYMLISNNWGNVWKNMPINKYYISPAFLKYLRNLFKIFFLFKGKKKWEKFDKKYLSYFTELNPHYPYFNYFDIIKDKRVARSSVAWHVEKYLKKKDLVK